MNALDRMAPPPGGTESWAAGWLADGWGWAALLAGAALGAVLWALRERQRAAGSRAEAAGRVSLADRIPEALVGVDAEGRIRSFNPAAERLFGYRAREVVGEPLARLLPDLAEAGNDLLPHVLFAPDPDEAQAEPAREVTGRHADGHPLPLGLTVGRAPGGGGQAVLLLHDRSLQRAMEDALHRESRFANVVINSLPGIFYLVDQVGCFRRWNRNLERVSGYTEEELEELHPLELFRGEDRDHVARTIRETFETGSSSMEADLVLKSGERRPYFFTSFRVELDGERYLAGMGLDISHRRHLEEELTRLATTDLLTGVANRMQFEQDLAREVGKAERYGRPLALIMLDVDHFKRINDNHGHESGDLVLQEVVAVAGTRLREVDVLARWGGEEFMVLAPETDGHGAFELAERIRQAVEEHAFPIPEGTVTGSFGVAAYRPGEGEGGLLRRTDQALYRAKDQGRNQVARAEREEVP
ncbi:MAG: diguanylate cyclase [Thiohalospira sp.]